MQQIRCSNRVSWSSLKSLNFFFFFECILSPPRHRPVHFLFAFKKWFCRTPIKNEEAESFGSDYRNYLRYQERSGNLWAWFAETETRKVRSWNETSSKHNCLLPPVSYVSRWLSKTLMYNILCQKEVLQILVSTNSFILELEEICWHRIAVDHAHDYLNQVHNFIPAWRNPFLTKNYWVLMTVWTLLGISNKI